LPAELSTSQTVRVIGCHCQCHCQTKQRQQQARDQHVGAALDRLGHNASPAFLESRVCHGGLLEGKKAEQSDVDQQRFRHCAGGRGIDRLRHQHIADETNRVQEGREEDRVTDSAINEGNTSQGGLLIVRLGEESGEESADGLVACALGLAFHCLAHSEGILAIELKHGRLVCRDDRESLAIEGQCMVAL
jgi:hypothetical protein